MDRNAHGVATPWSLPSTPWVSRRSRLGVPACLGVLAKPIVAETGWNLSTVFLGFTIALLVMGSISTWVGRLIDRIGARLVMTIGTTIVSAGLLALSQVQNPASYFAVWAVLGVGMRCCLYDAAFAGACRACQLPRRKRRVPWRPPE
jgi:MFS family permease